MFITPRRLSLFAGAVVVLAACGSSSDDSAADSPATAPVETSAPPAAVTTSPVADAADSSTDDVAMEVPAYASGFQLALTSDAAGAVATGNEVTISVAATGYELSCDWAGKPLNEQFGHYHVLLDSALVDMECDPTTTVSMQNVAPGTHSIAVVPALDDHHEVMENMQMFEFDYEPTAPLPEIVDAAVTADPVIRIVSPKAGDVVSGEFDVVVEVDNYELSCDLYGKPGLLGYGHYHVNLDSTTGPMMGMGTMLGMGCTTTFTASTVGLESGATHSVIALLADNGHAPLMNAVAAEVEVTVG